jgi:hypothetical protein
MQFGKKAVLRAYNAVGKSVQVPASFLSSYHTSPRAREYGVGGKLDGHW